MSSAVAVARGPNKQESSRVKDKSLTLTWNKLRDANIIARSKSPDQEYEMKESVAENTGKEEANAAFPDWTF